MLVGGAASQGGVWLYVLSYVDSSRRGDSFASHFAQTDSLHFSYLWHSFLPSWIGNALGAVLIVVPMVVSPLVRQTQE